MYKVVKAFTDGENGRAWPPDKGGFPYGVGDVYPKEGFEPSGEHISYLLGTGNNFGVPVIEKISKGKETGGQAAAKTTKGRKKANGVQTPTPDAAQVPEKEGGSDEGATGTTQTPPATGD